MAILKASSSARSLAKFFSQPRVRNRLWVFGLFLSAALVFEFHPQTRGGVHDLFWIVRNLNHLDRPASQHWKDVVVSPSQFFESVYRSVPVTEGSPAAVYQERVINWKNEAPDRYSVFATVYHEIPDEENGFLQLQRWAELDPDLASDSVPKQFADLKGWKTMEEVPEEALFREAARWLENEGQRIDRALQIGLLERQSNLSSNGSEHGAVEIGVAFSALRRLELASVVAAFEGNDHRAYQASLAMLGMSRHFLEIESPNLIAISAGQSIELALKSHLYDRVLPLLRKDTSFEPERWAVFFNNNRNPEEVWPRMWRAEWQVGMHLFTQILPQYHPRDPERLLTQWTEMLHEIAVANPYDQMGKIEIDPDRKLTRLSRELLGLCSIGLRDYSSGILRQHTLSSSYDVAFAMQYDEESGIALADGNDYFETANANGWRIEIDESARKITAQYPAGSGYLADLIDY